MKFYLIHFHVLGRWVCGSQVILPCTGNCGGCLVSAPLHSQNGSYLDDERCGDLNQGLTGSVTSHRLAGVARTHFSTSVPLLRMVLYQQCHSHSFSALHTPLPPSKTYSKANLLYNALVSITFISWASLHSSSKFFSYIHFFIKFMGLLYMCY